MKAGCEQSVNSGFEPQQTSTVSPLFQAALEASEEAVYNSLLQATSMRNRGQTVEAIPIERVREILKKYAIVK